MPYSCDLDVDVAMHGYKVDSQARCGSRSEGGATWQGSLAPCNKLQLPVRWWTAMMLCSVLLTPAHAAA